ncbi:unnamed protein product [Gadus morhua 'NCC']
MSPPLLSPLFPRNEAWSVSALRGPETGLEGSKVMEMSGRPTSCGGINLPPPGNGERPVNGSAPQARLHTKGRQSRGTEKGPRPTGPPTHRAPDPPGP